MTQDTWTAVDRYTQADAILGQAYLDRGNEPAAAVRDEQAFSGSVQWLSLGIAPLANRRFRLCGRHTS